jgi:hypothetical protein
MAIMVLTAGLASPLAVVFAPGVAREWDRRSATLVPLSLRAFRTGVLLLVPAAAAIVLLGVKPAEVLLSKLDTDDVIQVFRLVLILVPGVLGTILSMIPITGVMAQQRLGALAGWSLVVALAHAATCGVVAALDGGLEALAVVTTVSALVLSLVPIMLAVHDHAGQLLAGAAVAAADLAALPAAAFAAAGVALDAWSSFGRGVAAFAVGGAVWALWMLARHRAELASIVTALRPAGT